MHGYFREADDQRDQRGNCGGRIDPATRYVAQLSVAMAMALRNCLGFW